MKTKLSLASAADDGGVVTEEILEPDLPIIDPHHHLWDLRPVLPAFPEPRHPFIEAIAGAPYYTFDALQQDTRGGIDGGHNIVGTVFMECGAFYDSARGEALKPVGEVEFVNGVAAQGASGLYGVYRPCAGIVGHADLTLGGEVRAVLEALSTAGNGRFRGIRHAVAWDADPAVLGPPFHAPKGLYLDATFRDGFTQLGEMGLTFDAWVLEPQLPDVIDLARAFPDQAICLDHCGTPLGIASYQGKLPERFDTWRENIRELAQCENVVVKLGGLAMAFCMMPNKGRRQDTVRKRWPSCGDPMSKHASKRSGRNAPCSKAIIPSIAGARATMCCGIRSSGWLMVHPRRKSALCSPERPRGSTASSTCST